MDNDESSITYHDAYQIYELLDKWNHLGPPDIRACRRLLLRDNPDEARRTFLFGSTLLHKCVEYYGQLTELVMVLLESYPDALQQQDDNGFLPLHRLLMGTNWGSNIVELVQIFISRYPESIMEATNTGTLPLHLACKRADSGKESKCIDVVRYLLTTFPDAVRYRDNENKFPLDHALQDQVVNLDIIRLLIQEYPVLLSFPDDSGMLPLHRTLKSSFGLRHQTVVELLVDGYEGALRLQDKDGYTPLLYACTMNRRLSTVYSLVRKWPEQVMVGHAANSIIFGSPDKFNGELLHSSFSSKASKLESVVQWLERYPDGIWNKDLHGRLPIHYAVISPSHDALAIVCLFLEHEDGTDSGCNDDVENKDDGRPRRTRQLATPDNDGRLPLHFASACPRCSNEMLTMLIQRYPKALIHEDNDGRLCWHYADLARQDVVFEETTQRYRDVEYDLELVPEEIRWDIVQVLPDV